MKTKREGSAGQRSTLLVSFAVGFRRRFAPRRFCERLGVDYPLILTTLGTVQGINAHEEIPPWNERGVACVPDFSMPVLERPRSLMQVTEQSFEVGRGVTGASNFLTTNTAVGAGLDRFAPAFIKHRLGGYEPR